MLLPGHYNIRMYVFPMQNIGGSQGPIGQKKKKMVFNHQVSILSKYGAIAFNRTVEMSHRIFTLATIYLICNVAIPHNIVRLWSLCMRHENNARGLGRVHYIMSNA